MCPAKRNPTRVGSGRTVEVTAAVPVSGKPIVRSVQFTGQRGFRKALNDRVEAYLRENKLRPRDVPAMYAKTGFALAWWLASYLLLLLGGFPTWVNLILCVVFALAIASVGFNVMHDANHRGYSDNSRVNRIVGLSAEMVGISGFRWRTKHNVWHHTYTNIAGFDDDIEAYGLIRLSPRVPWRPIHRFQQWYFPLVYSLIAFDFMLRDFLMAFFGRSDPNHVYPKMPAGEKVTFWLGKVFHFVVMIGLPMLVFPWWQVIIGYMFVMLLVGLLLGVVFQLAHISGDAQFPVPAENPLRIENEWAAHQVETTVDFAPRNRVLNFYIGGLNYQIEHHLLPHICHINYPRLAPIVERTCAEFGLPYISYPSWRAAFAAHWRQLAALGRRPA